MIHVRAGHERGEWRERQHERRAECHAGARLSDAQVCGECQHRDGAEYRTHEPWGMQPHAECEHGRTTNGELREVPAIGIHDVHAAEEFRVGIHGEPEMTVGQHVGLHHLHDLVDEQRTRAEHYARDDGVEQEREAGNAQ